MPVDLAIENGTVVTPLGVVKTDIAVEGEKILATANGRVLNENIRRGRDIYLCTPATAAASAINGAITDPTRYVK